MIDDRVAVRSALVGAIAGENRLRREALREEATAESWRARVDFAGARGLDELASAAALRRQRHIQRAALLRERAADLQLEVRRLRRHLNPAQEIGRGPPETDALSARFRELEVEGDLAQLKRRRAPADSNVSVADDSDPDQ